MSESLSGGTTHLLRMARSECKSAISFVALSVGDDNVAIAAYPDLPDQSPFERGMIDDLVHQLWLDPGLARGKALLRTVALDPRQSGGSASRLAVAAVPLGSHDAGHPRGLLGVADPEQTAFGVADLELLSRIARRLASYVAARQVVRRQIAVGTERRGEASGFSFEPEPPGHAAAPFPAPERGVAGGSLFDPGPHDEAGATVFEPEPQTAPERSVFEAAPRAVAPHDDRLDDTLAPPLPDESGRAYANGTAHMAPPPPPAPEPPAHRAPGAADVERLLAEEDRVKGLVPLGALLGRTGRLLGAGSQTAGSLAVVAFSVTGSAWPPDDTAMLVSRALRAELRFDDPVARVDEATFVAVVPLAPGGTDHDGVTQRLATSVRAALEATGATVGAAHVAVALAEGADADDLVRAAVGKLRVG